MYKRSTASDDYKDQNQNDSVLTTSYTDPEQGPEYPAVIYDSPEIQSIGLSDINRNLGFSGYTSYDNGTELFKIVLVVVPAFFAGLSFGYNTDQLGYSWVYSQPVLDQIFLWPGSQTIFQGLVFASTLAFNADVISFLGFTTVKYCIDLWNKFKHNYKQESSVSSKYEFFHFLTDFCISVALTVASVFTFIAFANNVAKSHEDFNNPILHYGLIFGFFLQNFPGSASLSKILCAMLDEFSKSVDIAFNLHYLDQYFEKKHNENLRSELRARLEHSMKAAIRSNFEFNTSLDNDERKNLLESIQGKKFVESAKSMLGELDGGKKLSSWNYQILLQYAINLTEIDWENTKEKPSSLYFYICCVFAIASVIVSYSALNIEMYLDETVPTAIKPFAMLVNLALAIFGAITFSKSVSNSDTPFTQHTLKSLTGYNFWVNLLKGCVFLLSCFSAGSIIEVALREYNLPDLGSKWGIFVVLIVATIAFNGADCANQIQSLMTFFQAPHVFVSWFRTNRDGNKKLLNKGDAKTQIALDTLTRRFVRTHFEEIPVKKTFECVQDTISGPNLYGNINNHLEQKPTALTQSQAIGNVVSGVTQIVIGTIYAYAFNSANYLSYLGILPAALALTNFVSKFVATRGENHSFSNASKDSVGLGLLVAGLNVVVLWYNHFIATSGFLPPLEVASYTGVMPQFSTLIMISTLASALLASQPFVRAVVGEGIAKGATDLGSNITSCCGLFNRHKYGELGTNDDVDLEKGDANPNRNSLRTPLNPSTVSFNS